MKLTKTRDGSEKVREFGSHHLSRRRGGGVVLELLDVRHDPWRLEMTDEEATAVLGSLLEALQSGEEGPAAGPKAAPFVRRR